MVKNPAANAGDAGDVGLVPGLGRDPGVGNGNPLQYSCLENCTWTEELGRPADAGDLHTHGPRSLADYSPWGRKELDVTEHKQRLVTV